MLKKIGSKGPSVQIRINHVFRLFLSATKLIRPQKELITEISRMMTATSTGNELPVWKVKMVVKVEPIAKLATRSAGPSGGPVYSY